MEQANEAGDIKKIYKLVKNITGKPRKPPSNLTTDENGFLLQTPEDVAKTWRNFLSKKFSATTKESTRPEMEFIPKTYDPITRKEFNSAIRKLNLGKATGPDGIPAVVYKACPQIKEELFKLLQYMWSEEVVPTSFVTANFKMLFKGKGSRNDPSKYRCIALLNHAYKVLSYILLGRLIGTSDDFLKDWQAGFRSSRGCRDNSMTLRVICERMIALGRAITAVFIDYRAAFDSVSHKFVDQALKKAGASVKARAMYRAIYRAAAAYTESLGADNKRSRCDNFNVGRGVLQGDVTSPLFFIMALELIMRCHDAASANKRVKMADIMVHLLGYADDAVILEDGSPSGIQRVGERVNAISTGSKEDADMLLNTDKTEVMNIRNQDEVTPLLKEEALDACKFICPHLNCGFKFFTKAGMKIHAGTCDWKEEFEVDHILDHRGPVTARQYLIRWKDYSPKYDTWEPRNNIHHELIREYELANGAYIHEWRFRCDICDLPCSSTRGIAIHKDRKHKADKEQQFAGTLAADAVQVCKLVEQQDQRPSIVCDGATLKNVFRFKYLGSVFTADAKQKYDIKTRIAKALSRCGELRNVLDSRDISTKLKIRLYQAAVCSILTYGCETWRLTPPVMRQINGANSKMLARFTGKSIPQEARPISCSYNLVRHIRQRRMKWLGDILRAGPERITYQAVEQQRRLGLPGNLLMDAPPHTTLEELATKARDRGLWKGLVNLIS